MGRHQREETNHSELRAWPVSPGGLKCLRAVSYTLFSMGYFIGTIDVMDSLKMYTFLLGVLPLKSRLVTNLSKLSSPSKNYKTVWPNLGDTLARRRCEMCISVCALCDMYKSQHQGLGFFVYLSFHVTLVQLRLWGKPSLSCQNSWCALSQTIYWCWV